MFDAVAKAKQELERARENEAAILERPKNKERGPRLRRARNRIRWWERVVKLAESQAETRKILERTN